MQVAALACVSDETCWEFVATTMAPLSLSGDLLPDTARILAPNAEEVVNKFLNSIADGLPAISQSNVIQHLYILCNNSYTVVYNLV